MALSLAGIETIAAQASQLYAAGTRRDAVVRTLKQKFQGLTITGCLESDLSEEPFREEPSYLLYLVDSHDHCWKVTREPARATGIVIAEREEAA
ncbi:hypothetical protein JL101_016865 [Skermanella rosea]|uniref:hypothetical protein n=1 Tax=Skermanella rosea TaxID=1817965 RepID=UPI0019338101|nr:hypothetical protein [Skermanella rosea]UEM01670.1 hypothetical protein JL101_016865 [Skermanella rosea]